MVVTATIMIRFMFAPSFLGCALFSRMIDANITDTAQTSKGTIHQIFWYYSPSPGASLLQYLAVFTSAIIRISGFLGRGYILRIAIK